MDLTLKGRYFGPAHIKQASYHIKWQSQCWPCPRLPYHLTVQERSPICCHSYSAALLQGHVQYVERIDVWRWWQWKLRCQKLASVVSLGELSRFVCVCVCTDACMNSYTCKNVKGGTDWSKGSMNTFCVPEKILNTLKMMKCEAPKRLVVFWKGCSWTQV